MATSSTTGWQSIAQWRLTTFLLAGPLVVVAGMLAVGNLLGGGSGDSPSVGAPDQPA